MSTTGSSHVDDITCPDPSVHSELSKNSQLQNNASKAALLAAEQKRSESQPKADIAALGPDGKLSSAGAATSLKYAKATDLPSFPSVGIDTKSSGGKAASLANSNQKSFEWWKPEASSNAGKAAQIANKDGGKLDLWQYKPDGAGSSAAHMAMGKNSSPQLDYGYTEDGRKKALLAATLSVKKKPEPVVEAPPPEIYPDSGNASYNALNAATSVAGNQRTTGDLIRVSERATEAARYTHAKGISRDMYGERPPVAIEQEEKRKQDALRASAVVMAKKLYEIEKPQMEAIGAGDIAARKMHEQQYGQARAEPATDSLKLQAMNYLKVQEAAQKLAAERLAKLDPDGVLAYKEHYGYGNQAPTKKLTVRGRSRRSRSTTTRSDDDYDDSSDDEVQAARIRNQTRGLNDQVASVDAAKREQDRKNLLAAAQKSVQARMHDMDERVFAETGKVSPAMMAEWEAKARAKAEANSNQRMETHGKVNIGGGKYMDQSEVDAIALGRLQPTLDELAESAEHQRARDAEIKADQERRAAEVKLEKEREADRKANARMLDREEKAKRQAEKDEEKAKKQAEKDEEKAKRQAEKDAEKAEKNRLKEAEKEKAREEKERAREEKEQAKREKEAMKEQVASDNADGEQKPETEDDDAVEPYHERIRQREAAEIEAKLEKEAGEENEARKDEEVAAPAPAETAAEPSVEKKSEEVSPGRGATLVSPPSPTTPTKRRSLLSRLGLKKSGSKSSKKPGAVITEAGAEKTAASPTAGGVDVAPAATLDADAYKSGVGESEELQARSKGKGRAESVSSLSSDEPAAAAPAPVRTSEGSNEEWSEAQDNLAAEPAGKTSTGSRDRDSKFQEVL